MRGAPGAALPQGSPLILLLTTVLDIRAGIGLGRVLLAWLLEKRLSERSFVTLLLALMSGALAVLWAVRNVPVDAVAIAAGGFFLGPTAPKALAAVADRVPVSLKSSVVSLTVGLGLIGSALGPLLFGFAVNAGFLGALPMTLVSGESGQAVVTTEE